MPEHKPFALPTLSVAAKEPVESLTESQEEAFKLVLNHFTQDEYALPTKGDVSNMVDDFTLPTLEKGELTEEERFWLSRECLLRFLRASRWSENGAIQRLEDTLRWRREFGLYSTVTPEHVEPEAVTGKQILFGYDTECRPGFYMYPSRQNTPESMRQAEFAIWMMERSIDLMDPGVESIALLINLANRTKKPSMTNTRRVLNLIQTHYPERLGRAMIINAPFWMQTFFTLISVLIDPSTRAKICFNPRPIAEGSFAPDQLMREWNGGRDFVWSHDEYWRTLVELSAQRRKTWMARWRELGGTVGIREWDYKRCVDVQ